MMIRVDPTELTTVAEMLRSCSTELADTGSSLWSCLQCPMPAELASLVDQLVAAADRALDLSALELQAGAVLLSLRAQIAHNDIVAAATLGAGGPAPGPLAAGAGVGIVGGTSFGASIDTSASGSLLGPMVIGGSTFSSSIGSPSPGSLLGPMVVGGSTFSSSIGTPSGGWGTGSMIIGGGMGGGGGGVMSGVMALAQTAQNFSERAQARIDRIVRNPASSPFEIGLALNAQAGLGWSISHQLAPSRRELEDVYGPLTESEIRSLSPYTLFEPPRLIP